MLNKAIDKIRDEMAANTDNAYVQCVGAYLTEQLQKNDTDAVQILKGNRTIAGSLKAMEEYARQHKSGNVAVVCPEDGYRIVREYFGITEKSVDSIDIGLDGLLD